MVEAVLFDYGMVLALPPEPEVWQRMRSITGLSEKAFREAYWAYRDDHDRDLLNARTYWPQVAEHAGTHFTPEQVARLIATDIEMWSRVNPPMLAWAQRLQRAGVRTGILSNIGDFLAEGFLAKFDWLSDFYHCTWSYQLKLAKPDAAIYSSAAEGLKTPPANILFLDDRAENVAAARAAGMQSIQYDYADHAAFEREMQARGLDYLLYPARTSKASH
ncbi:MAG: HAD family phosphatase [Acidobacteriaceae bacterium]|nr:HAD family phosphatase [Acidobacteriaceae bacterium]